MRRWLLVASPGDKRERLLQRAIHTAGDAARTLSWDRACEAGNGLRDLVQDCDVVRIESPGADPVAQNCLARLGGVPCAAPAESLVRATAAARGLHRMLLAMSDALQGVPQFVPAAALAGTLDKRLCAERLEAAGIPVIPTVEADRSGEGVLAAVTEPGSRGHFLKTRWGSAGMGVVALRSHGGRWAATSAMAAHSESRGEWVTTKRLRRLTDSVQIGNLVRAICREGAVLQPWQVKASCPLGVYDLRALAFNGCMRHVVGRASRGPITNLHLDNRRIAAADLQRWAGPEAWLRLEALVAQVAQVFPDNGMVACDILVSPEWRQLQVIEVNGWGDLLPGIEDAGEDPYLAGIRAWREHGRAA